MAGRLDQLPRIHQACWDELAVASRDKGHPFRLMALATADGDVADLRLVVLREVQVETRSLLFFTDARSPKVAQMQARPTAKLVVWSDPLGWQLRLQVQLSVQTSGLAVSSRWARLKMKPAAYDYLSPLPPGAPLEQQASAPLPERGTRDHFAVVTAEVQTIDWLELHGEGHRRALFDADGQGRWIAP